MEYKDGKLTGVVIDPSGGRAIPLSGTCEPFEVQTEPPEISTISFRFTVLGSDGRSPVEIFIAGYAFKDENDKSVFRGTFIAFPPLHSLVSEIRLTLGVDPGDTGTGNGNQT
jgi:hypothetical protein